MIHSLSVSFLRVEKAIGGKIFDRWKTNEPGEITRAKSRLIAFGYQHKEGIDYFETFTATPNAASTRLLLARVVKGDCF